MEAKYIADGSCCAQLIWMRRMLMDYGVKVKDLVILYDSNNLINMSKNPVQHSRTKHIELKHLFIRELIEKRELVINYGTIGRQLPNIFIKNLNATSVEYLKHQLDLYLVC